MIVLLGSSGYFGRAFANELRRRSLSFIPLSRSAFDYTRFDHLFDYLRTVKPVFLINAAGYECRPEADASEETREQAMMANAVLPQVVARVCLMTKTPWGHLSSGSIYTGAKIADDGATRVERDLSRPDVREMFDLHPQRFFGFNETDEPNFSFHCSPSTFLSGTKALAEEAIRTLGQTYLWRPRLAFNEVAHPNNYLSQFRDETRITDTVDSMSHTGDCVRACLDLWKLRAPYGIYNVTNPGAITTRRLAEMAQRAGVLPRPVKFRRHTEESAFAGGRRPESHCLLDVSKLLATGVKIRPVEEAWQDSLNRVRLAVRAKSKPKTVSPRALQPYAITESESL